MDREHVVGRRRLWLWLWLSAVPLVAGWVVWESQRVFRADWASAATRSQVTRWAAESAAPDAVRWESARAALQSSLDITPDDPDLQERMGDLFLVAVRRDSVNATWRRQQFEQAARCYEAATRLRASEPQSWAKLAVAYQAMGGAKLGLVHAAWARSLALGPFESHVQPVLMHVVLSDWDGASPLMRGWAEGLFDAGNEGTRNAINATARRYGLVFAPTAPPR